MGSMLKKRRYQILEIIVVGSFFAFGLFYEYLACIFGGILGIWLLWEINVQKRLKFYFSYKSLIIIMIVLCYLIAALYGVDIGMGSIGFFKNLTIMIFLCCVMQLDGQQRNKLMEIVPLIGCGMVLCGIVSYAIKPLYDFFFTAERFGGFFQYANVFAIFCLSGIIILTCRWKSGTSKLFYTMEGILLLVGILLSGSRTVFVLTVISFGVLIFYNKNLRMPLIVILAVIVLGAAIYAVLTGNVQSMGRFLTISTNSSTFCGRILYAKDGIRLLAKHPFGLGYLGYYFMESSIQTGVYSIRYIHNDFLQMALDIGIIPVVFFVVLLITGIISKRNSFENRLILFVVSLHMLMDFDLEFTCIWFLIILCLDIFDEKNMIILENKKRIYWKVIVGVIAAIEIYIGGAMFPRYLGDGEISAAFLPFYTEAQKEILMKETESDKAKGLAEQLLKQNKYVTEAYDVLAAVSYQNEDYIKMSDYKRKSVEIQKYNKEAYEKYVVLLSAAIEKADQRGNMTVLEKLLEDVLFVKKRISIVERETDELAYKIKDIPDFTLHENVENYILQVEEITGN